MNKNRTKNLGRYRRKTKDKTIRFYKNIIYPQVPDSNKDIYVITTTGDRLDLLANEFYGDVKLWWIISSANRDIIRRDSYALKPGLEIRIPNNINHAISAYNNMNQKK